MINLKLILMQITHHTDFYDGSNSKGKSSSLNGALRRNAEALRQESYQPGTL